MAADGFDEETDVLVIGAGGGGFVTALAAHHAGLATLFVEKSEFFGGSTVLSGGSIWIPNAPPMTRKGFHTSFESNVRYLESITEGEVPRERIEAFLTNGPEMVEFLESLGPHLRFEWRSGYPDYHPTAPGGSGTGRSFEAIHFDRRRLGDLDSGMIVPTLKLPRGMWIRSNDLHTFLQLRQNLRGKIMFGRLVLRMVRGFLTRERIVTRGEALIGRLRLALRDAGVPLRLRTSLQELITEDGAVVGAVLSTPDGAVRRVRARRGVVIASGGFDHNRAMRQEHHPIAVEDWSMGAASLTGDGIAAGQRVGGAVDFMDDAWWMPGIPWSTNRVGVLLSERQIPGQIIVNGDGRRFTDEAGPYTDFVHDMIAGEATGVSHNPVWLILDDRSWRTYMFAGHLPLPKIPAPVPTGWRIPRAWMESGAVRVADSLDQLAGQIGVPAANLTETVARFNEFARRGQDDDFGRGSNVYDNYYGDSRLPNPNLRELLPKGPYYAFKVVPGDLGTKGGLVTDEHARVLTEEGAAIPGLYAIGNASASVMGHSYAGPGGTIGPAMTFGYIAAKHLAKGRD